MAKKLPAFSSLESIQLVFGYLSAFRWPTFPGKFQEESENLLTKEGVYRLAETISASKTLESFRVIHKMKENNQMERSALFECVHKRPKHSILQLDFSYPSILLTLLNGTKNDESGHRFRRRLGWFFQSHPAQAPFGNSEPESQVFSFKISLKNKSRVQGRVFWRCTGLFYQKMPSHFQ